MYRSACGLQYIDIHHHAQLPPPRGPSGGRVSDGRRERGFDLFVRRPHNGVRYVEPLRFFRRDALPPLKLALAVYSEARVEIDERTGLILYPSPPPVSERKAIGR